MAIIKDKLKRYHYKKSILQISAGLLNLMVLLFIVWCSTVFLDMTFYFSEPTRWFVLIVNGGFSLFLFYRFFLVHILTFYQTAKTENYITLTNEIGLNYPEVEDKLTNIYQLENLSVPEYSKNLRDYASKKFTEKIKSFEFTKNLKFSDYILPKHVIIGVLISSILAAISLFEPMTLSLKRILIPYKEFSEIPAFTFDVQPGDNKIIKGKSEKIQVVYFGPKIDGCTIQYKNNSDSYWQSGKMQFLDNNYVFTLNDIRNDITYKINGIVESNRSWQNKIFSDDYRIKTIIPPQISELQISITPPNYTKLPVKYLEKNVGDIVAYKGSICNVSALVNKKITRSGLVLSDSSNVPMQIRDMKITGNIKVEKPGIFSFNLSDAENISNQNPIEYSITVLDDYSPTISIIEPDEEIESIPDAIINLQFEGNDDFGFTDIKLNYQVIGAGEEADSIFTEIDLPVNLTNLKYFSSNYLWDLSTLPIGFDESLKYYVSVVDNDFISGPKIGHSKFQFIRFPSLQQLFEDFASTEEKNIDEMEDIAAENEKLQKELEKIKREFKQDKKLDWERKKEIESTLKKQHELQEKLNNIENEIEEAVKKLAEKNLLSPEILDKYNQLQELFQEIASPELLQAMQELQKSIESVDKKKVEQTLNKMSFNQKQFKEKLERTLELFKKIQLEQELDRLVQMAKMLSQQQEEISAELEKDDSGEKDAKLKDKQSQQSENLKQLSVSSENVLNDDQMKSFQEAWEKLNEANNYSKEQQLQNQMNQIQNQMSNSEMSQAKKSSQSLEQQMQMLLSKMQQSQAAMNKQNKDEIMAKMRKTTNNLLRLSKDEEKLMNKTGELSNLSDEFRDMAQSQQEITENMQKVIKDIVDLSKETFFLSPKTGQIIGKTYGNMNKGLKALEERNKNGAGKSQNEAMAGLNQAVVEMQGSMQSISQSKSGMGFEQFMKQMQQMAGKQGQLNQQGMELMQGKGNSGSFSMSQQGELARMAAQQQALRKSLEQLNSEMGNRSDVLGRMDNIADEMKKVVEDMQMMNYSTKTIQRQQNILSRMLDAQKSVREREYSKKRKAEVGKQYARKNLSELQESVNERKERLRKELKRALEEGYSIDYEKLIEEYFRNLNNQMESN
jgi:uncharacterized protein DUF4175